ncbi:MAG: hypothetical protein EHM58_18830 [Ignavibacteriae bacterium]|nr:MAG: hypothetical protein EHM58_18830 [Ignavibacteriota bacterium]
MNKEKNTKSLKSVGKESLIEVLEERKDLLHDAILEVFEDIALSRAMQEGSNRRVSRKRINRILQL